MKLKKMEQEMEQVFEMKVKEKKKKLKDSEAEVSWTVSEWALRWTWTAKADVDSLNPRGDLDRIFTHNVN